MGVLFAMTTRIPPLTTRNARSLRCNLTDAEKLLWQALRQKQLNGNRFRRQHPIGKYITDFACIEQKLVIELDGGQHQNQLIYDAQRTTFLEIQGWCVLRFWNNEVLENLSGVLAKITENLKASPPP
ncbi:MAG: endonuclease domain-containing protein [Gallionella sp.]